MNQRLKDYLEKCSPATVDETMLDDLRREMEKAVPEIAESIRRREELAAQLRIATSRSSQANSNKQDWEFDADHLSL